MAFSPPAAAAAASVAEEDEWDDEGFEVPRLAPTKEDIAAKEKIELEIGANLQGVKQSKWEQLETNASGRKQKLKNKLKDANKKGISVGHENKVDELRDLIGGSLVSIPKGGSEEWLDPHCHESMFEKPKSQG